MADISPQAVATARKALGVPDERIPRSVAVIMDGNGRWGAARNLPRAEGHRQGAVNVRRIVTEAARLGLDALTLYSFSIENWSRPRDEIGALMHLYAEYLVSERPMIMQHNIRLRHLGRRDGLPAAVLRELDESLNVSAGNTGMYLCLALNYGARTEIADACARLARQVQEKRLTPEAIDERAVASALDTAGVGDPDLMIRTAGEFRLSNFLLWQSSYAEFYVTDVYWPDFDEAQFHKAIVAYAARRRRFGGLDASGPQLKA